VSASNDTHSVRAYAFASLRLVTGFAFLWAFLDKTFGFGYATPSGKGWIDGGSSANGFLSGVAAGPVESAFHDWAGETWADWLFAAGLLGIGIALVSGIALRPAALVGTAMMVLMWIAEWRPAQHLSDGSAGMSANPFMDYHVIYAAVLIALVLASAGDTWGLGKQWAKLPIVRENDWLR
jgi:thiosulfate dehydrogenase [quinone] large subunit